MAEDRIDPTPGTGADARLLDLIGDTMSLLELDAFHQELIRALRRAVPSDWVALNEIGPDPESVGVIIDPPAAPALFEQFRRHAAENPLIQRYATTRDGRAFRFSDVISSDELHRLDLYRMVYLPMGIEHQIAFTLPSAPDRLLGISLSRATPDYSDADRDLLNAARPFLVQAHRNAMQYSELLAAGRRPDSARPIPELERLIALGLTDRQAHILQLVVTGAADRDIATHLRISPRTVQKHLERCYRALGVASRADAVAAAWAAVEPRGDRERIHRPLR